MEERRSIERFSLELPMHVEGESVAGGPFEEETGSINISSRGAYFLTKNRIEEGTRLDVTLSLAFKNKVNNKVLMSGTVIRVEKVHGTDGPGRGVALLFEPMSRLKFKGLLKPGQGS